MYCSVDTVSRVYYEQPHDLYKLVSFGVPSTESDMVTSVENQSS